VQAEIIQTACHSCGDMSQVVSYKGIESCKRCGSIVIPNGKSTQGSSEEIDVVERKRV